MIDLEEMDEETWELLQQAAATLNVSVQEVVEKWGELCQAVGKAIATIVEKLSDLELPELPRTPAEIKKEIKYEKNPMRLKQLNKELNESYKVYKRRK